MGEKLDHDSWEASLSLPRVNQISIYPVKSTAGQDLDFAYVEPQGLKNDRQFMLVNASGTFLTGRQHPILTQIHVKLSDETLVAKIANKKDLRAAVDINPSATFPVTIFGDEVVAGEVSVAASKWFSDVLDTDCRLVAMPAGSKRATDPAYSQEGDHVSFADGYPLLLISEASLADLNTRLENEVVMARFRPNLVVSGEMPYAEDSWQRIRIGDVEFDGVKNCARCVFTTIDPQTGKKDSSAEPFKTLMNYRRTGNKAYFGQNLIPRSTGRVSVGDTVEIIETTSPVRASG